jgi:tetratricopeptide (TPR) repeat protein
MRARLAIFLLLAATSLAALACSDKKPGTAGADATSGDELREDDNMAVKVAPSAPAAAPAAAAETPKEHADYSPHVGPAPVVKKTDKPKLPTGPSPWGAPDAQCGTPLPPRPEPKGKAADAMARGKQAAARGDFAAAKVAYEQALVADPRAFQAAHNIAVLADRQGQTNQALQGYARAIQLQPDYERSVEGTARIYIRQGNAAQAVAYVEPFARRWECSNGLQVVYCNVLIEANRIDEAEQVARKVLRRDERSTPAMVGLANASLRRGRYELADSVLAQALTLNDKNAEAHYLTGVRHKQEGRTAQALESYRKAVEINPDYVEARMALGLQYMAAGNYVLALEQLEALSRIAPTLVAVHLNLGDAYRANRRFQDAKRSFDAALRMQEQLPEAHFNLGLMYMEAGADFPGLQLLDALQRAVLELSTYRDQMGPRLLKDDPSGAFLADLQRQIDREKKRIERDAARKARGARQDATGGAK